MNRALATATAAMGVHVGPATVIRVERDQGFGRVVLATPAGDLSAELALAFPYQPRVGDIVLALSTPPQAPATDRGAPVDGYVIGVLSGRGQSVLSLPADAEIRAEGRLKLTSPESIELESPNVKLRADKIELLARAVFERVIDSYRWIKGVVQTIAGRSRTVVAGTAEHQAERVQLIAKQDVRIDGERINIG